MIRRRMRIIIGVIIFLVIAAAILFFVQRQSSPMYNLVDQDALAGLAKKDQSGVDTSHLAPGVTPPTNKWFSGIALQKDPKTVFPSPLGFQVTQSSFSYGLPNIQTSAQTISGGLSEVVTVTIAEATSYQVTRYDELSVDLTFRGDDGTLGVVTLLEGSPYIQFSALTNVNLSVSYTGVAPEITKTALLYDTGTTQYHVAGFDGVEFSKENKTTIATAKNGSLLTMYALPAAMKDDLKTTAGNKVTGSSVSYEKIGDGFQTNIAISTKNKQGTAYTYMPHQKNEQKGLFSYNTLYGTQRVVTGDLFSFRTDAITVADTLDLSGIAVDDKALLVRTLRQEINATTYQAPDTYFAGKELYRSAQLLQLAQTLGEDNSAMTIRLKLRDQLESWLSGNDSKPNKYFYYDTNMHSIVGVEASFGSVEINDHHFHYGYFIYAASILAKYDKDFLQDNKAQINLIVADIANTGKKDALPLYRTYDPFMSHSWASGSAPFNDGNNQESSSEAMNAWMATALWAEQTGNTQLRTQSEWMLSGESAATKSYWLDIDTSQQPYRSGYAHSIVSLNWGGKRDYATFFSDASAAKLGIQLLPMSPTMKTQAVSNSGTITTQVNEALSGGDYGVQFGDYILMYSLLAGVTNQLDIAKQLPDSVIDSANSRSYLYAWIMSFDTTTR